MKRRLWRSRQIGVKLTPHEYAMVEKASQENQISGSEYIRRLLMKAEEGRTDAERSGQAEPATASA